MQATESKRSGYGDTSQHKNWENFRNATFDETPFVLTSTAPRPRGATCRWCFTEFTTHCTGEFEMPDPPKGVLEFDYVSTARPRRYTRKMRRQYVCGALSVSFPWFGRQLCCVSRRVSRAFVRLGRYLSQKLKKLEYTPETVAHKDWDPDAVRVVDSTKCNFEGRTRC